MDKHPVPQMGTEGQVITQRAIAYIIDAFLAMIFAMIPFAVGFAFGDSPIALLFYLLGIGVYLTYFFLLEGIYGYRPGKYLMGLVVVKSDGSDCTIGASIVRNLLLFVDNLPFLYIVGIALMYMTDRHQRVGDLAANTVVVKRQ